MKRWLLLFSMAGMFCNAQTEKQAPATPTLSATPVIKDSVFFEIEEVDPLPASSGFAVSLYYHDSLGYGHPASVPRDGAAVFLTRPTFFLQSDEKQTPFLVYPGERINIRYSKNAGVSMSVKGDPQRTKELAFFPALVRQTDNLSYAFRQMPHLKGRSKKDSVFIAEQQIHAIALERMSLLSSKKDSLSEGFLRIAANAIQSAACYDSLVLYWNNRTVLGPTELRKKIAAKAKDINALEFSPYIFTTKLANAYAASLLNGNPNYVVSDSASLVRMYALTTDHVRGATANFVLTRLLLDAYNKAITVTPKDLADYYRVCGDEEYKDIVRKKLTAAESISSGSRNADNLRWSDGKTIEDLQQMLKRYKGKLLVLDFWASWCIPCRAEMPAASVLRSKYADKPVAFLYVSMDANAQDWKKAADQEKLHSEDSYLFLNSDDAPFVRQFGLHSIPRYMLIGKDGRIILKDAPRPSDPELVRLIDRYL
ncbi:TlpA family protein disulfide reductase [Terrimonas sp. NA20]|uniref:TlpA family protein disulfide reductase n=1 Tax=Terrimonas ginsenosidimutans TaxID=2908004 RepID=A0ABS9KK77_9BACT|nr:TlpA disulfide reductase family protein [Terrimonas ginsenosidimutans]MCG2612721.1 TlpA family protein disulfide reductase [Terrimonas ginsenosidimutans]